MPSHRWGKLNHGQTYGLLADDIGRRLATIRLGEYERLLLNYIREHSWARSTRRRDKSGGWPDALPFEDTITAVACDVASGIVDEPKLKHLRKKLYEAVASLKRDRILVDADGESGGILINTNCDNWDTYTREFLPTGAGVAYALKARSGRSENAPLDDQSVSPGEDITTVNGTSVVSPGEDTAYPLERIRRIPPGGYENGPPYNPPCEARASEDLIQTKRDEEIDRFPPSPHDVPSWKTDDAPGRIAGIVADRFRDGDENGEYYRSEARGCLAGYPEDVIERAILAAPGNVGTGRALFAYVAKSLPTFLAKAKALAEGAAAPPPSPALPPSRKSTYAERRAAIRAMQLDVIAKMDLGGGKPNGSP